jgi:2-oxoglutarate ferredoxin oxidoreductase subunit beta
MTADDYDVHDRVAALSWLQQRHAAGELVTGLLYVDPEPTDLHQHMNTVATPFNELSEKELCPGSAALGKLNASLR